MNLMTTGSPSGQSKHTVRTVLVVEDDEPIRTSTSEFLRDCGFVVIEAGDVTEAQTLLLNWHVDLVFSDINLPNRESGFALEKWVRHYYPDVKILLTSGYPHVSADPTQRRALTVQKPYSYSALLRRIDAAFAPAIA
jgi:DNA-binding NtrC family response regulator